MADQTDSLLKSEFNKCILQMISQDLLFIRLTICLQVDLKIINISNADMDLAPSSVWRKYFRVIRDLSDCIGLS